MTLTVKRQELQNISEELKREVNDLGHFRHCGKDKRRTFAGSCDFSWRGETITSEFSKLFKFQLWLPHYVAWSYIIHCYLNEKPRTSESFEILTSKIPVTSAGSGDFDYGESQERQKVSKELKSEVNDCDCFKKFLLKRQAKNI